MFEDMKKVLHDWEDEDEIRMYLTALLNRQAFDQMGLIYGMGHAVYSISDPRAKTFRKFVRKLSESYDMIRKGRVISSPVLGVENEGNIQYFCFQRRKLAVRTEHMQNIFSG